MEKISIYGKIAVSENEVGYEDCNYWCNGL